MSDFYDLPPRQPTGNPMFPTDREVANAATYISFQAFHIRRALERIADALEKNNSSD